MNSSLESTYIDDHLDLYLYALQLGDQVWANELLHKLRNRKASLRREEYRQKREMLYRQFDAVNMKLLEAYRQLLHESGDEDATEKLHQHIWRLKLERISITNEICITKQTAHGIDHHS